MFEEKMLFHSGVGHDDNPPGRGSGRYAFGSGDNPYQRGTKNFLERVDYLRKNGCTFYDEKTGKTYTGDPAIARALGFKSVEQLRSEISITNSELRRAEHNRAVELRESGMSLKQITKEMGYKNDSSIRTLLNEETHQHSMAAQKTADFLKERIKEDNIIDVGKGVAESLGISEKKLGDAVYILQREGYEVYNRRVAQATNPGKYTTVQVVCKPGTQYKDIYDPYVVKSALNDYETQDGGLTYEPKFVYPKSMDSSRMQIRYADDGGKEKDGVIEIRRGVEDLDLGNSHYAQVRILVDDTHYLKGMAVYSDDMPKGVDVIFNTNKPKGTPALGPSKQNSVLKPIGNDPKNPFNSLIKPGVNDPDSEDFDDARGGQSYYYDKNGNKQLSLINKRAEEGDWEDWADKLPSQFLSKQPTELVKRQLGLAITDVKNEYDDLSKLTNPTVKRALLMKFADECDSAAEHLQAAALPSQKYHVILPMTTAKDNEIYAPRYKTGQTVALVRYPHAGTFEIPILKVNNNLEEGKKIITPASPDAVGINSKVAQQLSGADFDGDTVMVIPCNDENSSIHIMARPALEGLKDFDPTEKYGYEGNFKKMNKQQTQNEMGRISNLITDMTVQGATDEELARAVRHSMVVIDAEKHGLDYKQSEKDNRISELKTKYQLHYDETGKLKGGAATIISRAKSEVQIPKTRGAAIINPDTGEVSYKPANETYVDKKGKEHLRMQKSTQMAQTSDAMTLVSEARTPTELAYAEYANTMKSYANAARKQAVNTGLLKYSPSAYVAYKDEVESLNGKLLISQKNKPRERMAQLITDSQMKAILQDNPEMTGAEKKKVATQKLTEARASVGARRTPVEITDREWEAIRAGAISDNKLTRILNASDPDRLRQLATPLSSTNVSQGTIQRMQALRSSGKTLQEISEAVGLSVSSVSKYLS